MKMVSKPLQKVKRVLNPTSAEESLGGEDAEPLPPVTTQSSKVNELKTGVHDSTTMGGGKSLQTGQSGDE